MIVFFPKLLNYGIVGTNTFTAELIRHRLVREGINDMIGGALVLAALGGALSLGIAAGAALMSAFFLAALFIFKIGDTSILAVLYVSSAVVWGFYPLAATRWIPRAATAGIAAALILPIAWSLIFSTAGLLGRDALLWTNPAIPGGGLTDELESIARPLAAVACLWVAYKAPTMLLGLVRQLGINPSAVFSGGLVGGGGSGGSGGRSPGAMVAHGMQRGGDRFRALRSTAAGAAGRTTGYAGSRAAQLRNQAGGRARRATGKAAIQLAGATSPAVATGAINVGARVGTATRGVSRGAVGGARAGKNAATWWRGTARRGAAQRRSGRGTVAAFRDGRSHARTNPRRGGRPGAARTRPRALDALARHAGARQRVPGTDPSRPRTMPRPQRAPARAVAIAAGRPLPAASRATSSRTRRADTRARVGEPGANTATGGRRDDDVQRRAPRGRRALDVPARVVLARGGPTGTSSAKRALQPSAAARAGTTGAGPTAARTASLPSSRTARGAPSAPKPPAATPVARGGAASGHRAAGPAPRTPGTRAGGAQRGGDRPARSPRSRDANDSPESPPRNRPRPN